MPPVMTKQLTKRGKAAASLRFSADLLASNKRNVPRRYRGQLKQALKLLSHIDTELRGDDKHPLWESEI